MVFRVAGASSATGYFGYYGSFYSDQDQSAALNTATPMTVNKTAEAAGVSVANNGSGNPSRITFTNAGTYNIQFSAQLHHTGGAGSGNIIIIWFRLNGTDIAASATKLTVTSSSPYLVASWNFVQTVTASQYIEIMWATDNVNVFLEQEPAGTAPVSPIVPSVIITAQQIR
jgi:hypothetical protein